jgi:hypothetical protein
MDAEDIRTAAERIRHAEARVAACTGHDTAGLRSQLEFAKAALEQGRTLDVLAICEEVLLSAKRLTGGGAQPVRTDRVTKATERQETQPPSTERAPAADSYPSGVYAPPATEVLDRHRLTEEIRQAVQSDLMPKALSAQQLQERIQNTVSKAFEQRIENFKQELEERFQRLAATPDTTVFAKPAPDLVAELEKRLEARSAGIARSTAQAIHQATAGLEARIEELADPDRMRSLVGTMIDNAVRDGIAAIDLKHQESAARRAVADPEGDARRDATLHRLETSLADLERSLPERLASAMQEAAARTEAALTTQVSARLDGLSTTIDQAVANHVSEAIAGTTEAIAGPVRELVTEALAKAAPPDLDALAQRLGKELRADLDWQVERLAAERGWVSLADVQSELSARGGTPSASPGNGGFARLEAALVEFVHQTQSQQQQFLNLLQERVEQGTAVVAQNLARAMGGEKHSSSTVFRQGKPELDAPRKEHAPSEHRALEARPEPSDTELDVLSKSAQFRAISTLEAPIGTTPGLPGTQVTRRTPAPTAMPNLPPTTTVAPDTSLDDVATATTTRPDAGTPTTDALLHAQVMSPVTGVIAASTPPAPATAHHAGLEPRGSGSAAQPATTADTSAQDAEEDTENRGDFPSTTSLQAIQVPAPHAALTGAVPGSSAQAAVRAHTTREGVGESSTARLAATPMLSEAETANTMRTGTAPAGTAPLTNQSASPSASRALVATSPTATPGAAGTGRSVTQAGSGDSAAFVAPPPAAEQPATSAFPAPGTAAVPAPTASPAPAAVPAPALAASGVHRATERIGALETGLRALVRSEVDRQLAGGLKDSLRQALGLEDPPLSSTAVAAQIQDAVGKALAEHAAIAPPPAPAALNRDDLVQLLKDPAVRQQVLAIVAVEALANPGALGELTGIRAFIRHEVRNASQQDPASLTPHEPRSDLPEPALTDPGSP